MARRDQGFSDRSLRELRVHRFFVVLLAPWLIAAAPVGIPVSVRVDGSRDAMATGTAKVVGAMLTYTRWPGRSDTPLRLCIVGPAVFAGRFSEMIVPGGREVRIAPVPASAQSLPGNCDAVYMGELAMPVMRQITARLRGAPVLTIAEADPLCRSEAMFCLVYERQALSFQLNIDAVSRSAVTVDPRVLRLSRGF